MLNFIPTGTPLFRDGTVEDALAHAVEQVEHYPWDEEQKGLVYEVIMRALICGKILGRAEARAEARTRVTFSAPQEREGSTE